MPFSFKSDKHSGCYSGKKSKDEFIIGHDVNFKYRMFSLKPDLKLIFFSITANLLICGQKLGIIYIIGSYCGLFVNYIIPSFHIS